MRKRFLIVVGLAKSGTTFLFSELAKRPDVFAMPLHTKEVDYFRQGSDRGSYLNFFDREHDKVFVDASPLYIDNIEVSVRNIRSALRNDEVRVVVCLRDPLERAFSHYLHDIAQHQKIIGHADYSFWSPSVMAKYILPVLPRVRFLKETFGEENVFGFAFGADVSRLEAEIRLFAGLSSEWSLDLSDNPAPGFTSPEVYYNRNSDSEVLIGGELRLLRRGQLLVVNRQYSILRRDIDQRVAEQIVLRQSSLTRQLDTARFGDRTRDLVYDDMSEAARILGVAIGLSRAPRVMHSKPSDRVPDHILAQLPRLGAVDEMVERMMRASLAPTMRTIASMPVVDASLSRDMARLQLALMGEAAIGTTAYSVQREIVERFGPIPIYIEAMMRWHVARGQYDAALGLFDAFGGADRLLWPMDLASFLVSRNIVLPEDILRRFESAGVRVRLPS